MMFVTPGRVRRIDASAVIKLVEDTYGYPHGTLARGGNAHHISHPRHLVAFLLIEAGLSFPDVGKILNVHHTTAIHSRNVMVKAIEEDEEVRELVDGMRRAISVDPDTFLKPLSRIKSVVRIQADTPAKMLPNIANGMFRATRELDELIVAGLGDKPRMTVEELSLHRTKGTANGRTKEAATR